MQFTLLHLSSIALLSLSVSAVATPDVGPFVNAVRPVAGAPGEYSGAAPAPAPIVAVPPPSAPAPVVAAAADAAPVFHGDGPRPAVVYNPTDDDSARAQAAAAGAINPVEIAPIAQVPAAQAAAPVAASPTNLLSLVQPVANAQPAGDASAIVRAAAAAAVASNARPVNAAVTTAVAQPRGSASSSRSVRTVDMTTTLCRACGVPTVTATVVANTPVIFTGGAGKTGTVTFLGLVLGSFLAIGSSL